MTASVFAADPVTYLDADGTTKTCTTWQPVVSSTNAVTWGEAGKTTWYVAEGDVTITNGGAYVWGDVRLVLTDGCDLKVYASGGAGIDVCENGNSLTIYAQSTADEMGALTATGSTGIGGSDCLLRSMFWNYDYWAGNITINGGRVTARGCGGAGIGTSGILFHSMVSNIVINGGIVHAEGATGIGGPSDMNFSGLGLYGFTMTDGELYAIGHDGAGIGGGNTDSVDMPGGVCHDVVISGGFVHAVGANGAAGIGGGAGTEVDCICRNIQILDGSVLAEGGEGAPGIGAGLKGTASGIYITKSQSLKADGNNPPTTTIANGGGDLATTLSGKRYVTVKYVFVPSDGAEPGEGSVPAGGLSKFDATCGWDGLGHTINTEALSAVTLPYCATPSFSYSLESNGVYQTEPIAFTNAGEHIVWYKISAPNYEAFIHQAKVTISEPVTYLDVDGTTQVCTNWLPVVATNGAVWGSCGKTTWYVAEGVTSFDGSSTSPDAVTVQGDVRLILKDGCQIYAVSTRGAGINVTTEARGEDGVVYRNALTIYAQSTNATMGCVVAMGTAGAGIGGGATSDSEFNWAGNITIHGGNIKATGGGSYYAGAGIGGGGSAICASNIVINGGVVTATTSDPTAAGIGGSQTSAHESGSVSDVFINGGTVTATGHTGIGSARCLPGLYDDEVYARRIVITGGRVTASGTSGVGIGGGGVDSGNLGNGADCFDIVILGGCVTAAGGTTEWGDAVGIGGGRGEDGDGGDCDGVYVMGGEVYASSIGGGGGDEEGVTSDVYVYPSLSLYLNDVLQANHSGDLSGIVAGKSVRAVGPSVEISAPPVSVSVDGEAHGLAVTVSNLSEPYTVEYALSQDGPWQPTSPTFTDECNATVWYRVSTCGMVVKTSYAHVQVTPAPAVTDTIALVGMRPRYPWTGLVDFTYAIENRTGFDADHSLRFSVNGIVCSNFIDAAWCDLPVSNGTHTVTWDSAADGWSAIAQDVSAKVELLCDSVSEDDAAYLIIDVSEGAAATNYPVRYVRDDLPSSQFLHDAYKTSKIVLKKVTRGEFKMGDCNTTSAASEQNTAWHWVRLTQDFFLGIFEVTQAQYKNVMGSNPSGLTGSNSSYFMTERVNMRPVERLQFNATTNVTGFLGILSSKAKCRGASVTKFLFPTEAQWEYACRAGCENNYYWGSDTIAAYGNTWSWYGGTAGGTTHEVGLEVPNAWGFYDMAGNVGEYCMDLKADYGLGSTSPIVEDPLNTKGTLVIIRGGAYYWDGGLGRSGNRTQPGGSATPDLNISANSGHWGGAWVNSLGMRICTTVPK